ncbi:MAG: DUF3311 domain-containing protein [Candidatus Baltobacteraceae bacterium]
MKSLARFGLAAIPSIMLIAAPFLVNADRPRVFGLPLLLAWIVAWVVLTPFFLFGADRFREER